MAVESARDMKTTGAEVPRRTPPKRQSAVYMIALTVRLAESRLGKIIDVGRPDDRALDPLLGPGVGRVGQVERERALRSTQSGNSPCLVAPLAARRPRRSRASPSLTVSVAAIRATRGRVDPEGMRHLDRRCGGCRSAGRRFGWTQMPVSASRNRRSSRGTSIRTTWQMTRPVRSPAPGRARPPSGRAWRSAPSSSSRARPVRTSATAAAAIASPSASTIAKPVELDPARRGRRSGSLASGPTRIGRDPAAIGGRRAGPRARSDRRPPPRPRAPARVPASASLEQPVEAVRAACGRPYRLSRPLRRTLLEEGRDALLGVVVAGRSRS